MRQAAASPATTCHLCGLPLGPSPVTSRAPGAARSYCCHGCAHVDAILEAFGRESEKARLSLAAARRLGLVSGRVDPPVTPAPSVLPALTEQTRFHVDGMACPSCAFLLRHVLLSHPGVVAAEVDFLTDTCHVAWDRRRTSSEEIALAAAEAGYALAPPSVEHDPGRALGKLMLRAGVAGIASMNIMVLSFVHYDALLHGGTRESSLIAGFVEVLLAVPALTWAAWPIWKRALQALRRGRAVMETLLAAGIASAAALSIWAFATGTHGYYLETATMLAFLALAGRAVEAWLKSRAVGEMGRLLSFRPTKVRAPDGSFVPREQATPGTPVMVLAGEEVPVDLTVTGEPALVDRSILTGESRAVVCRPGETVHAGCRAQGAALHGMAAASPGESLLDRMQARVFEVLARPSERSRRADRVASWFTPAVLGLAVLTVALHALAGSGIASGVKAAISVLVVACPCAFGIAASFALSLAVLRLARGGILLTDSRALEDAASIDTAWLDKTGTLTQGRLSLQRIAWLGPEDPTLLSAVAAAEHASTHPVGLALARDLAPHAAAASHAVAALEHVPGLGVRARAAGRDLRVGAPGLFASRASLEDLRLGLGETAVLAGFDGTPAAAFVLSDSLRPGAAEMIAALSGSSVQIGLISGDLQEAVSAWARRLDIGAFRGGALPQEKASQVEADRARGRRVLFAGDGLNDAEAMAAADVGLAFARGSDLAMHAADVILLGDDLRALDRFLSEARETARVLRRNLLWAFLYNVLALPVAAAGLLNPLLAAVLMLLSSASVVLSSSRLAFEGRRAPAGGVGSLPMRCAT